MHSDAGWRAADVMGEAVLEPQATSDGPWGTPQRHYRAVRAGGYTCTSVYFSDQFGGARQCKCQCQCQPSSLRYREVHSARTSLAVHAGRWIRDRRFCNETNITQITLRVAVLSTPSWQGVLDYALEAARKSSRRYLVASSWAQVDGDLRLKIQYHMEHPIYHPLDLLVSKPSGVISQVPRRATNTPFRHFELALAAKMIRRTSSGGNRLRLRFWGSKSRAPVPGGFPSTLKFEVLI
uniref:Uncharacterized protein n=1 Tax=Pyricularia oryzae (strain P131) TaxID=1143193 RepID=L7JG83_PYRO1